MNKLTVPVDEYDHQTGNLNARITLVEYGDYECPYCALAHSAVKSLLQENGGIVRFVFRNFPMQTIHRYALGAALAAEAASRQHRFWEMHDVLFETQAQFADGFFHRLAGNFKMDKQRFDNDFRGDSALSKVNADFRSGIHSGVNGTPSFFLNDEKIELSELSYDALLSAVVRQINVLV